MTPTIPVSSAPISPLRRRLIEDMNMRNFAMETQRNYIRDVGRFATFLGRPPDTAIAEDVRRFQVEQQDAGVPLPTMNSIVSALRFLFTHTHSIGRTLPASCEPFAAPQSEPYPAARIRAHFLAAPPLAPPRPRTRKARRENCVSTADPPSTRAELHST